MSEQNPNPNQAQKSPADFFTSSHGGILEKAEGLVKLKCTLCGADSCFLLQRLAAGKPTEFHQCVRCHLVFVSPKDRLSETEEIRRYQTHRNDLNDIRYRNFLAQLANPLLEELEPQSEGLDFGCGPGPLLARILEEKGHSVSLYDPLFFPELSALERSYDFVTCSETIEHFHEPLKEFAILNGLLKPGGMLALMSLFHTPTIPFATWFYANDPTHVSFYSHATFHWIAQTLDFEVSFPGERICFLKKPTYRSKTMPTPEKGTEYR